MLRVSATRLTVVVKLVTWRRKSFTDPAREALAERQGCSSRVTSEGSRKQNAGLTNRQKRGGVDNLSVPELKPWLIQHLPTISELTPILRGLISYFRLTEVKGVLEELNDWIRRKL